MLLKDRTILITSGPTFAPIDSVRSIVNRSTGRMGCAIASECLRQEAEVIFCAGKTSLVPREISPKLIIKHFETVSDLAELIQTNLQENRVDAVIMAAAVLDYVPEQTLDTKKSSDDDVWVIKLKRTFKIIEKIHEWNNNVLIVGFKLQTNVSQEHLISESEDLMKRSGAQMVLANKTEDISDKGHLGYLIERTDNGVIVSNPLKSREDVAIKIIERLAAHLNHWPQE